MKKISSIGTKYLLVAAMITALLLLVACSSTKSTTTIPSSTPAVTTTSSMPSPSSTAPTTPPGTTTAAGQSVTINLVAQKMAFDQSTITVPAGASITMNFDNKDNIPHNFALYTDSSATKSIFIGEIVSNKSITYNFTAPSTPGTYFFRCDVHPTTMTGKFVVQ